MSIFQNGVANFETEHKTCKFLVRGVISLNIVVHCKPTFHSFYALKSDYDSLLDNPIIQKKPT